MLDVVGPDELVVIANTGDDVEVYGAYVSPDPDLVTFWLGDRVDPRGWGLDGDTFAVMDGLRALGVEVWFNLGDRDLAIGLERARRLAAGERLTDAQAAIGGALGVEARVLPMSDQPVRTRLLAAGRWWSFQEFMIKRRAEGPVEEVDFAGARTSRLTPEVLDALAAARVIVIGPSNPVISIGPILALPGARDRRQHRPGRRGQPDRARRGAEAREHSADGVGGVSAHRERHRVVLCRPPRRARRRRAQRRGSDPRDGCADGRR
jgi:LPPG:FO 2-phospho-L-lactate transferase